MRGFTPIPAPVAFAAVLVFATSATAQETATASRYSITPSNGGFVRLDTETGTVSRCLKRDGVWLCEPAEERLVADGQLTDLAKVVATLSERLKAVEGALEALTAEVQTLKRDAESAGTQESAVEKDIAPAPSSDATGAGEQAAPDLASRLIGPLVTMVGGLKRDRAAGRAEN